MLPATTLKPTFSGPRVPVAKAGRVGVSRAAVRVRAGPYDEELIATAVRRPGCWNNKMASNPGLYVIFNGRLYVAASRLWCLSERHWIDFQRNIFLGSKRA